MPDSSGNPAYKIPPRCNGPQMNRPDNGPLIVKYQNIDFTENMMKSFRFIQVSMHVNIGIFVKNDNHFVQRVFISGMQA